MLTLKPDGRTAGQVSVDRYLALYAADVVYRKGGSLGSVLFQKIIFQAKLALSSVGIGTPHFEYFRYHYGPYSPTLAADEKLLRENRLLGSRGASFEGREVVKAFRPTMEKYFPQAMAAVEKSASKRALWTGKKAMAEAYGVLVKRDDGVTMKLEDVPHAVDLGFGPAKKAEAELPLHVLVELRVALSGVERMKAGHKFAPSYTEEVHQLLG